MIEVANWYAFASMNASKVGHFAVRGGLSAAQLLLSWLFGWTAGPVGLLLPCITCGQILIVDCKQTVCFLGMTEGQCLC